MLKNQRVVIPTYGGPEVLQLIEEPIPQPAPDEVLIQVLATGVAHGDLMMRTGLARSPFQKSPLTPGFEVVGVVKEAGKHVQGIQLNQRVAALTVTGGYSAYICLKQDQLVPLPEGIDTDEATSLVLNYLTAYQMLHRVAKMKAGETILVHGAAGGVGTAMLQFGKLAQVDMLGTASVSKHPLLNRLGAFPIDYKQTDFVAEALKHSPEGIHAVFDGIGGKYFQRSFKVLHKKGRLIGYGFQSSASKREILTSLLKLMSLNLQLSSKKAKFYSIVVESRKKSKLLKDDLSTLFQLLLEQKIKPVIQQRFPLSEVQAAHRLMESGALTGKIILTVNR